MALSNPKTIFGVHQFSPYNRATGEFYGTLKVLAGSSLSLQGNQIKLDAGSNKYPWDIQSGLITADLSLKFKEYPAFVFLLFLGKSPTEVTTPSVTGDVLNFSNVNGSSILSATNGVSTVIATPATGAAKLKFGRYTLKAVDSTNLDIYISSDINLERGLPTNYINDLLKVDTVNITGATNDSASLGLRFTKVGTPAFNPGDTATFDVFPPYNSKMEVVIGSPTDSTPEFGAIVYAEKRSDGSLACIDVFRAKATGMPLGFDTKAFSESQIKVDCLYDATKGGVFKYISTQIS